MLFELTSLELSNDIIQLSSQLWTDHVIEKREKNASCFAEAWVLICFLNLAA